MILIRVAIEDQHKRSVSLKIDWRYWKADLLILSLSLLLLGCTNLFYSTNGFVHAILDNGTVRYCRELNTLGSDADNALLFGSLLFVPLLINMAIPQLFKLKIIFVTLSTAFVLFLFWGISAAERTDISATIVEDQNISLLVWIILVHSMVPIYGITMNRLKRKTHHSDIKSM